MRCYLTNTESRSFFDAYLILHDPCVIQIFSWRNSHQSSTLSTLDFILTEYWSRGMTKGENILRGFQKHIDIHWQVGILQINKTLDIYILIDTSCSYTFLVHLFDHLTPSFLLPEHMHWRRHVGDLFFGSHSNKFLGRLQKKHIPYK